MGMYCLLFRLLMLLLLLLVGVVLVVVVVLVLTSAPSIYTALVHRYGIYYIYIVTLTEWTCLTS